MEGTGNTKNHLVSHGFGREVLVFGCLGVQVKLRIQFDPTTSRSCRGFIMDIFTP